MRENNTWLYDHPWFALGVPLLLDLSLYLRVCVSVSVLLCLRRICVSVWLLTLGQIVCEEAEEKSREENQEQTNSGFCCSSFRCGVSLGDLLTHRTPAQWRERHHNYAAFCLANLRHWRWSALNEAGDEGRRVRPTRPCYLYGNETEEHERRQYAGSGDTVGRGQRSQPARYYKSRW